jgi:L-alanine-DL-glutamate epimerase-like enolase superfamily enzyme
LTISDLSVAILREVPEPVDNRQQCALIMLTAEDGTVGYGEANANPAAVKALLETDLGLKGNWDDAPRVNVLGGDATDPRELWRRLKDWSFWSCRAGLGHVALAAVGTAAWDLAGKLAGKPTYELLGPLKNAQPLAYCTLYHGAGDFRDTVTKTLKAVDGILEAGFQAAKVEPLPENAPEPDDIVELVRLVRERVGDDFLLLADVGYRWRSADEAIPIALQLDDFDLYALEAPFPPHDVAAYRALAAAIATPLCTGDQLTAAVEYLPVLESGTVRFVQGGAARTGIDDMDHLAKRAGELGKGFVPWGWVATGLTIAANLHLSVVHDNVPLIEYAPPSLYPEALLRNELFGPEPTVRNGVFDLPTRPGLGMDLNAEVLDRVRIA